MTKGLPIGSPLLFVCGVTYVKSISYMAYGPPIGSPLLFVCGATYVKKRKLDGSLTLHVIGREPLALIENVYC
jgi:hypothetical protein